MPPEGSKGEGVTELRGKAYPSAIPLSNDQNGSVFFQLIAALTETKMKRSP
ncbi:MAG: hypothetical protein JSW72_09430 [Candidatus Bathyarchaeota archaeon]|nr:MAG: hypothetical protein JSW72_09430 [Candidatus Bathyarchaeota archaeon]